MKRIAGLRLSGELVPRPVLVFAGVVPARGETTDRIVKRTEASSPTEPPWDVNPRPAAPGWYSVGQTFYRSGSGPCPEFGADAPPPVVPVAEKPGRARQLDLF